MKSYLFPLLSLSLLCAALTALASPAAHKAKSGGLIGTGDGGGQGKPVGSRDFIRAESNRLVDQRGRSHFLQGINYWACMNLAADDEKAGGDQARFEIEMDQLAAVGVNHLRIMAASEGATTPQPFRMLPALQPEPGKWNEDIFVGLDRCVAGAAKRGMRLTMTLGNTWQWSGGHGALMSWVHNNEAVPYPPSWNLTAAPQRGDGKPGWGNYTVQDVDAASYDTFTTYVNKFYADEAAQKLYKAHALKVMNRKNTITGVVYKDDPTILAWEPVNEPQPSSKQDPSDSVYNLALLPNATDAMLSWHDGMAAFLKSQAPRQLVTTGFEGKQGEWYFKKIHESKHIDYTCAHLWVQNWNRYAMQNSSSANLHSALDFAKSYIANVTAWSRDLGKPLFLEEFGMARDNWENNEAAGEYLYASKAGTSNKDTYFKAIFDQVQDGFIKGKGSMGTSPWAYGGIYRPENQTLSSQGILWAGDPQHEAPGWYDVYSDDKAMQIIKEQHETIKFFLEA